MKSILKPFLRRAGFLLLFVMVIPAHKQFSYAESSVEPVESVEKVDEDQVDSGVQSHHHRSREAVYNQIDQLLDNPPFKHQKEEMKLDFHPFWSEKKWDWNWRDWFKSDKDQKDYDSLFSGASAFARWVKFLLIAGLVLLLIYCAVRYRVWRYVWGRKRRMSRESAVSAAPSQTSSMKADSGLGPSSDIKIQQLWRSGYKRQAMAALYRDMVARLQHQGIDVHQADTELDIKNRLIAENLITAPVGKVDGVGEAKDSIYLTIIQYWLNSAYGHLYPETADAERLFSLWAESKKISLSVSKRSNPHE